MTLYNLANTSFFSKSSAVHETFPLLCTCTLCLDTVLPWLTVHNSIGLGAGYSMGRRPLSPPKPCPFLLRDRALPRSGRSVQWGVPGCHSSSHPRRTHIQGISNSAATSEPKKGFPHMPAVSARSMWDTMQRVSTLIWVHDCRGIVE